MRTLTVCFLILSFLSSPTLGGIVIFTSESAFNAEAPSLTTQDFLSAFVADGSDILVDGPLTSTTNNGVFSPGDISQGLSISSTGSTFDGNKIYVAGIGTVGNTAKALYTNGSNATMRLSFGPAVTAAGLRLISFTNGAAERQFDIRVFGTVNEHNFTSDFIPTTGTSTHFQGISTASEVVIRSLPDPVCSCCRACSHCRI